MSEQQSPAEVYEHFFGPAMFVPCAQVLLHYAAPQPGERVLDVACGTGIVTRMVAPLVGAQGRVVGLDVNPGMLAVARAQPLPPDLTIEWRTGNAVALDLPDDSFDLVLCQQGLQFFPDRTSAAAEMWRVLADGGRVALAVWRGLAFQPIYKAMIEAEARYLNVPVSTLDTSFSCGDAEMLYDLLSGVGFRQIDILPKTIEVRFATAERFVRLAIESAVAFIPQLAQAGADAQAAFVDAVIRETQPVVQHYQQGDQLIFPMHTYLALASK